MVTVPVHDAAFLEGILWPFKVTCAIVVAFLILDFIHDEPEDPDGFC